MGKHAAVRCFHCNLPVPEHIDYQVDVDGVLQPMCCRGCQAVAQAIVNGGLTDFYRHRTEGSRNPQDLVPDALRGLELYDRPELQKSFVRHEQGEVREAALILEGIVCAACVWLNERHVMSLPGVLEFSVNYSTHRARLRWDDSRIQLSDILRAIAAIGYVAHPFDPTRQQQLQQRERALALRRVAVAALGMMQVMMIAAGLWAGEHQDMDAGTIQLLRWAAFVISTPVVLYAGWPFFSSAWRDLRRRRLGMDVPVALALGSTYLASVWATLTQSGEVYFESVTMFVFFLLTGRFLEMTARQRAGRAVEELDRLLPAFATRVLPDGSEELVPVADLAPGARVRIRPGDSVPADGRVLDGRSSVDESLMTGESLPRLRGTGDPLVGGTVNVESPLLMVVEQVGPDTVLAGVQRLLDRAQTEKPRIAQLAETGTGWFVLLILLLAVGAGLAWWFIDPTRAFWVAIAVMVVSCPCALALATPTAMAAATGYLTRLGILVTRGHALETLARTTHVVFDKTGTLTEGRLHLQAVEPLGALHPDHSLSLAARLETGSEHPVARALQGAAPPVAAPEGEVQAIPGRGVEGHIDGRRYRLGTPGFVAELAGTAETALQARLQPLRTRWPHATVVVLGDESGVLAALALADQLRPEARATVAALQAQGREVTLLSGDAEGPVRWAAEQLGIRHFHGGLLPEDKLVHLEGLQREGAVVAMVGDGVNDAPVLSRAHVSLAMASGTRLAHASADMILYSDNLRHLLDAFERARATVRIIRQNLVWALGYNVIALPVAAAGLLTPWLAALGMSLSSLLVVLNALRLGRSEEPVEAGAGVDSASARSPGGVGAA